MLEIVATFATGTFFGAAIYINLAQHPATLATGAEFAGKFFPPMYAKASSLQILLALVGTVLGTVAYYRSGDAIWLVGSAFLVSVIPITLVFIKPINDQLLDTSVELPAEKIQSLLELWNPRHWVRSLVSGIAFICFLIALTD